MPTEERSLRADARRNRDSLLAAAADVFTERGTTGSLEAVARRAGVGVGTLYRHFPTRESLVEAVYRRELERVADGAGELLDGSSGLEALRTWSQRFLEYAATKRGLGDALKCVMECNPDLQAGTPYARLQAAVHELITSGIEDGSIRPDALADDMLRAMVAVFHIPAVDGWNEQARRILDLLLDGVAARPAAQ